MPIGNELEVNNMTTVEEVKKEFAFFGFTDQPLSEADIARLIGCGYTAEEVYSIGCDIHAGVAPEEAQAAVERSREQNA